ncbi:MAG: response regulator [Sphingobacteriaceae bacterium]
MKKTLILIIEDNNDIRESAAEILELAGYEVQQADNGKTGVEMAISHEPDLILCDIMMPELDGYGVLYLLGKNPKTAATPFIFLTAKAERIDMRKGMEMGADDYLTKPFDDVELLNAIESRLGKKMKQQAFYSPTLDSIKNMPLSADGLKELDKLIEECRIRKINKKQVIYYEGDAVPGIYLVLSGKVKTVKMSPDGRELLTGMYAQDEYFGVNAILMNEPYTESAEALDDTSLCMLPKESLTELLNRYPDVAAQFIRILSNNLKEKEEQLLQLAYSSVRKRMAQVLVKLSQREKANLNVSFKISRDDLAAMAGMATETVSRILSDFKEESLIERKGSQIMVFDVQKLMRIKN